MITSIDAIEKIQEIKKILSEVQPIQVARNLNYQYIDNNYLIDSAKKFIDDRDINKIMLDKFLNHLILFLKKNKNENINFV